MIALVLKHWRLASAAGAVLLLLGCLALYRESLLRDGGRRALDQVEMKNAAAKDAAQRAQRGVDDCYDAGGLWSTITGQCSR
ncbi:hypothetical protein [Chelatococcus asaccharovorans]|uniref:Uncharacterized protein n=1 Tax=Chelatococcus asaccharovorans TaxID=28210 RepID=A0A2V3UAI2_9HYPH|nr:hypothetical protein [Chelatococcus asaccharovorans]MBS7703166.1 hypothetical protein [Chelatococcus asaccharovorans]PXW61495.1 hypothetical protein C7450_10310 [Chelatococcus asaccharovorans]